MRYFSPVVTTVFLSAHTAFGILLDNYSLPENTNGSPSGEFGPPYDVLETNRMVFTVRPEVAFVERLPTNILGVTKVVRVHVEYSRPGGFAFQEGYVWNFDDSNWTRFEFDQSPEEGSLWISNSSSSDLTIPYGCAFQFKTNDHFFLRPGTNYVMASGAKRYPNSSNVWLRAPRDANAPEKTDNEWTIQAFLVKEESDGTPSTPSARLDVSKHSDVYRGIAKFLGGSEVTYTTLLETVREVVDDSLSATGCANPARAQFAVITTNGGVKLFDARGERQVILQGRDQTVTAVAFSHDGKTLLAGTSQGSLLLWGLADQRCAVLATNVAARVDRVAWLGNGRVAWGCGGDSSGAVLDCGSRARLWSFKAFIRQDFQSLSGSADGIRLAVQQIPGMARAGYVLDGSTGGMLATLYDEEHYTGPLSVCLRPDGHQLAAGYGPWDVILWDVRTARRLNLLEGHSNWVVSLAYSADGGLLVSGAGDSTARLWNTKSGEEVGWILFRGSSRYVESVGFSPKADYVFALSRGMLIIARGPSVATTQD